jgi:glycosyltransferase involved in cell wall biosynthesis
MKKRLLIVSNTDLSRDPRVNRQVRYLRGHYAVMCAGTGPPGVDRVEYLPLPPWRRPPRVVAATLLVMRQYERFYWQLPWIRAAQAVLNQIDVDGVLANDIDTLPLALRIAGSKPVIYDAHEFAPRQFEDRLVFRLFLQGYRRYLCREYMPRCAEVMTVCKGLADEYRKEVGVEASVVWSLPDCEDLRPTRVAADDGKIRLVHHGGASRSRQLEKMIHMTTLLDERFELYFMLVDASPGYLRELRRRAAGNPRVHFLPPVPMREIARAINRFDVGFYLLPPRNFNQLHALPNKFFEFVQARLAIAIGPSPEMEALVGRYDLGVVAPAFSAASLAASLNSCSKADFERFKHNAHKAARLLSAESLSQTLPSIVQGALSQRPSG